MFDWFDKTFRRREYPTWKDVPTPSDLEKIGADMSKVIPFPEGLGDNNVPPMPNVEKPAKIYYRFGLTDNNRISFQMGHTEITMNKQGCENLIKQLTFFMDQLEDEDDE